MVKHSLGHAKALSQTTNDASLAEMGHLKGAI